MPTKQSILVVEADDRLRQTLDLILQRAGYLVTTLDLSDGVEKFVSCWPCDLIIVDINQPALKETILLSEIHRLVPDLRMVLLANQNLKGGFLAEPEEQICEVLMKPTDPVQILDSVTTLLSRRSIHRGWPDNYATSIVTLN